MAEKWVNVENDPDSIDADVDEAIELLGNVTFKVMKLTIH